MTIRKSDRVKEIIKFVNDHPFCNMDSIFTKGKIPKSRTTIDLLYDLVSKQIIQTVHTESGKTKYYIDDKNWDAKTQWIAIKFDTQNFKGTLKDMKVKSPLLARICDRFSKLLDLRLRILEFEYRHAKKKGKNFSGNAFRHILYKFQKFQNKMISEPSIKTIRDFEKWLGGEITRDMYYLEHHSNSVSLRSLADKIGISKDRNSYRLTRQTQIHHQESLKPKNNQPESEYDEIFKRLKAERDRILVSNPNTTSGEILKSVCRKRLDIIKSKRSKRHNSERRILKDTIRQLQQNPTLLDDLLKEKENEI